MSILRRLNRNASDADAKDAASTTSDEIARADIELQENGKSFWDKIWPVMAGGAGLFSVSLWD